MNTKRQEKHFHLTRDELRFVKEVLSGFPQIAEAIVVAWAKANKYKLVKA